MFEPEDIEARRKPGAKPMDLQPMSVGELRDYIAALEAEIARAEETIAKKEAHKNGLDALFGGKS